MNNKTLEELIDEVKDPIVKEVIRTIFEFHKEQQKSRSYPYKDRYKIILREIAKKRGDISEN